VRDFETQTLLILNDCSCIIDRLCIEEYLIFIPLYLNRPRKDDSRDEYDRGRVRDRSRDRSTKPNNLDDRRKVDDFGRDMSATASSISSSSITKAATEKAAKNTARMQEESEKQERLAMVKRLTASGNDSDQEDDAGAHGMNEDDENYDVEEDMMALMGFKGFDSTKGKPIEENIVGAAAGGVAKHKKRVYRQYMNRKGGFNRPLQKIA
jgi:U4/U6.U5 tri-snRNP-associated protein 3